MINYGFFWLTFLNEGAIYDSLQNSWSKLQSYSVYVSRVPI